MKRLGFTLVLILAISCNAPKAIHDYDIQADFGSYDTFAIYPDLRSGLSQLDEQRLINSLEKGFHQKELSLSETPDLYINFYTQEFVQENRNRLGVGIGGGGGNVGIGVSGGIPLGGSERYLRLTIDLIDVRTDALVWQAVVESAFDLDAAPAERQQRFDQIVKAALEEYPPGKD